MGEVRQPGSTEEIHLRAARGEFASVTKPPLRADSLGDTDPMTHRPNSPTAFPGFPDFRANVTFVPLQFFTVVLPHRSRGCVRLVGFMLRRLLGWVDADGNPTHEQLQFTYRELVEAAGISRDAIASVLTEAQTHRLIECVQAPAPDRPGQAARSGIYTLRWSDRYTDAPAEFDGFFRREARPVADVNGPTAKAARKNIPNAFFDFVLRQDRLAVVRVVGAMLFRSIQWGPGGERKVPVSLSITELGRLTHLTRRHVHQAVQEARARGYIERTQAGCFDPRAGANSQAATYRIRWTSQPVNPVHALPSCAPEPQAAPYPISNRSEKGHGAAVGKGARDQSEKGNGHRSEKGNDISIKRSIKHRTTAAEGATSPMVEPTAAAGVMAKLLEAGFDSATARRLADQYSGQIIEQQLAWLPLRQANTNRLGLLRRAIEQNWSQPVADAIPPEHERGAVFARHYVSALRGDDQPSELCSPKEALLGTEFLRRLAGPAGASAAEWGRRFGAFVRGKSPPKPWLAWTLPVHGDEFARRCRHTIRQAESTARESARATHEATFRSAHQAYLREAEAGCRRDQPARYAAFETHQQEVSAQFNLSETTRALLTTEASRLFAFAEFMRAHGTRLHDFWQWDRQCNPHGWHTHRPEPVPGGDAPAPTPQTIPSSGDP